MKHKLDKKIRQLLREGKVKQAYEALIEITSDDENYNRFLNIKKASLAAQCGYFFMADFFLILAKENLPKNSQYYEILSEEAKIALQATNYEQAASCCEEAISANYTKNGANYLMLGHAQVEMGDYFAAIINYKRAARTSTSPEIRRAGKFSLATIALALNDYKTAESAIKACIAEEEQITKKSINLLMSIYFKQGKYQEADKFLRMAKKGNQRLSYDEEIDIIIAKALGKKLPLRKSNKYHVNQLIEYKRNEALKHIKKEHRYSPKRRGTFSSEIDIEILFDEVKLQMTKDTMINVDILDTYEVSYPNAGFDLDNNPVDKIRIITVPGTLDIVTMYPSGKKTIKQQAKAVQKIPEFK